MKALPSIAVVFALVGLAAAGGAPTHDDVIKRMLATLDKITTKLASITNRESADAAKPELQKSAKDWLATRAQAEKLPPPSREQKEKLEKEFKGKLEAAQKKLAGEVIRVKNIPGGPEALQEIRSVLVKQMK
ncbi:MAG: hypothetical protein L0Y71_09285 [Gemmataceae bacterium]|nr:hypothetical protein [Gemmataceae bacterium]